MISIQELRNALAAKTWPAGLADRANRLGIKGVANCVCSREIVSMLAQIEKSPSLRDQREILALLLDGAEARSWKAFYEAK